MATQDKDFKVKNGLIVGDSTNLVNYSSSSPSNPFIGQLWINSDENYSEPNPISYLTLDAASATYLRQDAASAYIRVTSSAAIVSGYIPVSASQSYLTRIDATNIYMPLSGSMSWSNISSKPDPIVAVSLSGNTTGAASATLTDLTNGQISITTNTSFATSASSINWAGVTGTPTTLNGYGITDAIPVSSSQSYLTRSDAVTIYAPLASASFTGTVTLPTNTSVGNVSSTELGYLDGVTSAIQTQINTKASTGKAIAMAIVFGG